jgi:hypothetical protein
MKKEELIELVNKANRLSATIGNYQKELATVVTSLSNIIGTAASVENSMDYMMGNVGGIDVQPIEDTGTQSYLVQLAVWRPTTMEGTMFGTQLSVKGNGSEQKLRCALFKSHPNNEGRIMNGFVFNPLLAESSGDMKSKSMGSINIVKSELGNLATVRINQDNPIIGMFEANMLMEKTNEPDGSIRPFLKGYVNIVKDNLILTEPEEVTLAGQPSDPVIDVVSGLDDLFS